MQLTICSGSSSLRVITSWTSSSVADRIASASLASTVMAPRSARSFMRARIVSADEHRAPSMPPFPARARARLRGSAQPLDLGPRQPAALPELEASQAERPERPAPELAHPVAHSLEHPPHLPLLTFPDRDLDDPGGRLAHVRRRGAAVLELHPRPQRLER